VVKFRRELERLRKLFVLLATHKMGVAGLIMIGTFAVMAIFAPYLRTVDPNITGLPGNILQPPSSQFWFGTDNLGRDIWSQIIYGTRISLTVGISTAIVTVLFGSMVGIIAGFRGGRVGEVFMRVVDFFMMIPALPLMIALAVILGPSIWNIVLVVSLVYWPTTARIVRSQTLSLRERAFVEASRSIGATDFSLMFGEILPNVLPIMFAQAVVMVAYAIGSEAVLAFLGLGDPMTISWGMMLHFAFESGVMSRATWWMVPPVICIAVLILAFTFLGTAVSDIMKPGYREARGL